MEPSELLTYTKLATGSAAMNTGTLFVRNGEPGISVSAPVVALIAKPATPPANCVTYRNFPVLSITSIFGKLLAASEKGDPGTVVSEPSVWLIWYPKMRLPVRSVTYRNLPAGSITATLKSPTGSVTADPKLKSPVSGFAFSSSTVDGEWTKYRKCP